MNTTATPEARWYTVADAKVLEGLKAGDSVRGTLKVERRSYAITSLEKR